MSKKVLVTEEIAQEGIASLQGRGYTVDVLLELSPEKLKEIIGQYDALIVRSGTLVTADLLDSATNLKIIGRAGVTVDNIDIDAATTRGIIVCNAPTSNIISAAEYTMAMLLSCARNVSQASASMHAGAWDRRQFMGFELYGKTLAIFGLGRVGSLVAERAGAFGMNVIAHDPYCSPERAGQLGVKLYENIEDVLPVADFITVHLPLTSDTLGMFGPNEFAAMKPGVIVVNTARGGIFNVDSLADFVAAGKIYACGLDVYEEEPCTKSPLHGLAGAVLSPHISALTHEAQVRAGEQIAEYVFAGLEGSIVPTSITSTSLPPEVINELSPYVAACKMMGRTVSQLLGALPVNVTLQLEGAISDKDPQMLVSGLVEGLLSYKVAAGVTDALSMAKRHGINVKVASTEHSDEYASAVRVFADGVEIASTLYGIDKLPRIISIMGYKIDVAPGSQSLILEYPDGPGRIGVIGTVLGNSGVNITTMQIGTKPELKRALVYINVEGNMTESLFDSLKDALDYTNIWKVEL